MLKGFKDFLMRGNVVDLAVAVVVGGAFGKVVETFISSIINPLLATTGEAQAPGLGFYLRSDDDKTFVDIGGILNALIVFTLTAAVVYVIIVVPMNHLAERRKRGEEPEVQAPSEEILLLQEIRDLLRTRA